MAAYRITALQKALDESVPSADLERANKQYTELTVKYRDMLQRDNHMVQRTSSLEHLEVLARSISKILVFWEHLFPFSNSLSGKATTATPTPVLQSKLELIRLERGGLCSVPAGVLIVQDRETGQKKKVG